MGTANNAARDMLPSMDLASTDKQASNEEKQATLSDIFTRASPRDSLLAWGDRVYVSEYSGANIGSKEIDKLINNCWLNDEIVNGYGPSLTDNIFMQEKFAFVDSLFWEEIRKAVDDPVKMMKHSSNHWSRRYNLTKKDFIIFPIHQG